MQHYICMTPMSDSDSDSDSDQSTSIIEPENQRNKVALTVYKYFQQDRLNATLYFIGA